MSAKNRRRSAMSLEELFPGFKSIIAHVPNTEEHDDNFVTEMVIETNDHTRHTCYCDMLGRFITAEMYLWRVGA